MGSRYGGLKQMDGVGPNGEIIMDYSINDAIRAGFGKVVFVIRHSFEQEFKSKINAEHFGNRIAVEYVFQELDYLPEGFSVPEGREKPWGTNHAILMAKDVIHEPFAIINADDKNGMFMVQNTKATVKTYSTRSMADFKARILECHFEGMYLEVDGHEVGVQFIGKFNVSNLLAVYGAAVMLGKQPEDILLVMSTLKSVSGRLEPIHSPEGYTAIVDYAHTPDALENVLKAIHEVLNGKGKVITVCGAGGNRDKGKRPIMAQEAVRQSDRVIITSDNPRFEEPQDIINDMLAGLNSQQMKKVVSIVDRKEAIRTACMLAQKGDVILIAGKGHEDYQEIKGVKHHFDDREVVRDIFAQ